MFPRNSVMPVGLALGVAVLVLLALLVPVSSVSAHDAVTGTNPEDGQSVDAVPEAIEISFTNAPLAMGSEVLIADAEGKDWAAGDVEIVDNMAVQPISPEAPAGEYTVTWRVVSSDSHPIEGSFAFTVTETASAESPASTPSPEQTEAGPAEPEQPQTGEAQQPATGEADEGLPMSFVIILALLVTALVIVVVAVMARRRLENDDA